MECASALDHGGVAWRWYTLAEDVEFHLELVSHGIRVDFSPETWVKADMPVTLRQASSQNVRWEQGRLFLIRQRVLPLLWQGIRRRSFVQVDAAAEQLIPPLSVPFALGGIVVVAGILLQVPALAIAAAGCLAMYAVYLLAALALVRAPWRMYLNLSAAPVYVLWKVTLYVRSIVGNRGGAAWVRTERTPRGATGLELGLNGPKHASARQSCSKWLGVTTAHGGAKEVPCMATEVLVKSLSSANQPATEHPLTTGMSRPRVSLGGVLLDDVDVSGAARRIQEFLQSGQAHQVVTVNLDFVSTAQRDSGFRATLNSADLAVADGMPLVWLSRMKGQPLPERVAGVELVTEICRLAAEGGGSVFLLGARPGVAAAAGRELQTRYPGMRIAGAYSPPFGTIRRREDERIVRRIRAAAPDVLLVALGSPRQDLSDHMSTRRSCKCRSQWAWAASSICWPAHSSALLSGCSVLGLNGRFGWSRSHAVVASLSAQRLADAGAADVVG